MRSKDDRVSGLQSHKGFNYRSGFAVCYRNDSSDNSHWLRIFFHSHLFINFYKTNGLLSLHLEIRAFYFTKHLGLLVRWDTHAGFFHKHFTKFKSNIRLSKRISDSGRQLIDLFLSETFSDLLGSMAFRY